MIEENSTLTVSLALHQNVPIPNSALSIFYNICRTTTRDEIEENGTLMVFLALPGQLFLRLLSALALPLILPKVLLYFLSISFVQLILNLLFPTPSHSQVSGSPWLHGRGHWREGAGQGARLLRPPQPGHRVHRPCHIPCHRPWGQCQPGHPSFQPNSTE